MQTQGEIHSDCLAWLQSADARAAFEYLIEHGKKLNGYTCFLHMQGYLRTYRYTCAHGWPFGFIVNRTDLLFYFRKAGLSNPAAHMERLRDRFSEVMSNQRGEIKVRLHNEDEARALMSLIFPDSIR